MSGNHPGLSNNFSRSGVKFSWSKDNLKSIKNIISKYPKGREQSAVMPLLYLAPVSYTHLTLPTKRIV